jgi:phosphoadenosine phosphosulfate reductase
MTIQTKDFETKSPEELLRWSMDQYGLEAGLASSFGMEDMVLIDMIAKLNGPLTIFTLDTGRLHEETYDVMERVRSKYGLEIKTYFPDRDKVQNLVREKGFFSFRESVDNRKECCSIRKVEPLNRALGELKAWITGLRRSQGVTRTDIPKVMEDTDHPPLIKINPLAEWTEEQVMNYIIENNVPINILHKRNYPSIGCAPCTRPVEHGEDIRAGRWWWENPEHKECGLHQRGAEPSGQ